MKKNTFLIVFVIFLFKFSSLQISVNRLIEMCISSTNSSNSTEYNTTSFYTALNPLKSTIHPSSRIKCNVSSDCVDLRMICNKTTHTCNCSKFHNWIRDTRECVANVSKIYGWLRQTFGNDSDIVSQPIDFITEQRGQHTILIPKWSDYEHPEVIKLTHLSRVLWPIFVGVTVFCIIYGAIILNLMSQYWHSK